MFRGRDEFASRFADARTPKRIAPVPVTASGAATFRGLRL